MDTKQHTDMELLLSLCWAAFGRGLAKANLGTVLKETDPVEAGRCRERPWAYKEVENGIDNVSREILQGYVSRWTDIGERAAECAGEYGELLREHVESVYEAPGDSNDEPDDPPEYGEPRDATCELNGDFLWIGFGRAVQFAAGDVGFFWLDVIRKGRELSYGSVWDNSDGTRDWRHTLDCARRCGARACTMAGNSICDHDYEEAWYWVKDRVDQVRERHKRWKNRDPVEDLGMAC